MMSRIFLFSALIFPIPLFASATEAITETTLFILSSYSLASALIVGIATSVLVAINARKMKGGIFGQVLEYFSVGMFIVLLGFVAGEFSFGILSNSVIAGAIHDVLYIIGYVIMAIAAQKLLTAIKGDSGI